MRVVYSESMNAPAQGYSPSAAKPAAVMAAWLAQWPGLQVRPPVPATREDFFRAHAPDVVDGFATVGGALFDDLPCHVNLLTRRRLAAS